MVFVTYVLAGVFVHKRAVLICTAHVTLWEYESCAW